jgi:predicted PurR-regulated permease PerM
MLRDGAWLADRLADTADRLLGGAGERLAGKMIDAVRGTVNGTVGVAIVEGLIIGIGYYVGGVPNPALFTLLTIAFAMLPMGAEIAVAAATLMLLLQGGGLLPAVGVFAFGMAVTVVGDNVFWPALVGRTARLPFLVTLIGVLGGVQVFGLIGLFLGPVIMTAFLTVWREWVLVEERPADAQPEPPDR